MRTIVEWREAFSDLIVCSLDTIPRGAGVLWVLQPNGRGADVWPGNIAQYPQACLGIDGG